MANIYWFTSEGDIESELDNKLVEFLQTDKRNWRSKVFYINQSKTNYDVQLISKISNYIVSSGCDVVVNSIPFDLNEDGIVADNTIFFDIIFDKVKRKNYTPNTDTIPLVINTAMESESASFNRIIHYIFDKK
jgi:hypothetical protein